MGSVKRTAIAVKRDLQGIAGEPKTLVIVNIIQDLIRLIIVLRIIEVI